MQGAVGGIHLDGYAQWVAPAATAAAARCRAVEAWADLKDQGGESLIHLELRAFLALDISCRRRARSAGGGAGSRTHSMC